VNVLKKVVLFTKLPMPRIKYLKKSVYIVFCGVVFSTFLPISSVLAATCTYDTAPSSTMGAGFGRTPLGSPPRGSIAQRIVPSVDCEVGTASFILSRDSGTSDDITVSIYSETAGSPGSSIVTGSTIVVGSTAFPPVTTYTTTFASTTLTSGVPYWFVVSRTGALSDTNIFYALTGTAVSFTDYKYSTSGVWTTDTGQVIDIIVTGEEVVIPPAPTSTVYTIDYPAGNLFMGFVIFGYMLWFTIWFFRKH